MTPPLRRAVLIAMLAIAVVVVGAVLVNRRPPSALTVESVSESAVPSPTPTAGEVADATCGKVVTATRPYGRVIVGRQVEALLPSVGQLIVIDPDDGAGPLRIRAQQRQGPGTLHFERFGAPSQTTVLGAHAQRTSPGWPGHWGVDVTVTGPGCWHLRVRGDGIDDRLVFAIRRADWRRVWRHSN